MRCSTLCISDNAQCAARQASRTAQIRDQVASVRYDESGLCEAKFAGLDAVRQVHGGRPKCILLVRVAPEMAQAYHGDGARAFVCVLPKDHHLAGKELIQIEDLAGEPLISLLDENHRVFIQHEKIFGNAGIDVHQQIPGHSSDAAYGLVAQGLGVALMEPFSAPLWVSSAVVTRPVAPRISYEFVAGLKPGALRSAVVSEAIEIARDIISEYCPS